MTHIFTAAVIPAQAGIQTDTKPLRSGDNTQNMALPATRNLYDKLDSRLRGNDKVVNFAYGWIMRSCFRLSLETRQYQAGCVTCLLRSHAVKYQPEILTSNISYFNY